MPCKPKDYETSQEIKWCPGCGDYAILKAVQKTLADLEAKTENTVFVSGIGCSSRFPYYLNTYGFHSIHGRAPAVATGLKLSNPELDVWMITGDGDGLSIGAGHLVHLIRRNLDIVVLLFNNQIYGLTKGQYSPTSEIGKVTKSTPYGSADKPLDPLSLALGSGASFVARSTDVDVKHLSQVLKAAHAHRGCSFVEIYQNCVIFNDKAFDDVTDRKVRDENRLILEDGKPMVFGSGGIEASGLKLVKGSSDSALVHDVGDFEAASQLTRFELPDFPVPLGVLYQERRQTFEELMEEVRGKARNTDGSLQDLLKGANSWEVA